MTTHTCLPLRTYEVCLETTQPFNIKKGFYLEQYTLFPFKLLPLGPQTLIPAILPVFKTIYEVLFRNRYQLPRRVFFFSSAV
jgi:hypothetical protein